MRIRKTAEINELFNLLDRCCSLIPVFPQGLIVNSMDFDRVSSQ